MNFGTFRKATGLMAGALIAVAAAAQPGAGQDGAASQPDSAASRFNIPADVRPVATRTLPTVARAEAKVNDEIITRTDIEQRVALFFATEKVQLSPEDTERLRAQVLRDLIDESLKISAAREQEAKIEQRDIDAYYKQFAQTFGHTPETFGDYLKTIGTSERSVRRQIMGELSWDELQRRLVPVSVSQGEVSDRLARLNAARGSTEYRIAEIHIRATPENAPQVRARLVQLLDELKSGRPEANFARLASLNSHATTAAKGGDNGWVSAERLAVVAPEIAAVVDQMPVGAVSNPIQLPTGLSIVALVDKRQVLVADPRDAVLSLMQMSFRLPQGATDADVRANAERLMQATQSMGGCGQAKDVATRVGADLVANDSVRARDLPGPLQQVLLNMNVGQSTQAFRSEDGLLLFVLCGRDDPKAAATPTLAAVTNALEKERMARQAARRLRDLRRDAVIEYR